MAQMKPDQQLEFVKILFVGTSSTGKTGALTSLVKAGYKLKIIDMDNGLDSLKAFAQHECPEKMDHIDYQTFRDKFKPDPMKGARVDGTAKAYTGAIKALNKWDDDSIPSEWGSDTILVLDSLTLFGRAAFRWAQGMNMGAKDPRQWYGTAQESILTVLDLLTSDEFRTNVIVISHIDIQEMSDGTQKGFASSIGKALGPKIPAVFNTMLLAESRGSGENVKRTITTMPTALMDLKNPAPFDIPKSLPLSSGLATVFATLKGKK